jgi:hypothetical protein
LMVRPIAAVTRMARLELRTTGNHGSNSQLRRHLAAAQVLNSRRHLSAGPDSRRC